MSAGEESAGEEFPLIELAQHVGARLVGDGTTLIRGLATLQDAQAGQLAFLANPQYRKYLTVTRAAAVIMAPDQADGYQGNALLIENPYYAYARLTALFADHGHSHRGIHPSAVIGEQVSLGQGVNIGPNVTIEPGAVIGDRVTIGAGCYIGSGSAIGSDSRLHSNVSIYHGVRIGERAILHSSVVVGSDGFGFAPHAQGWQKIHHMAGVRIGDDVELGACTTVDRGALADTVIEDGVKIDNLVQIAHGVKVGAHTVIAGCAGIAGSTEIGARCVIAGGVGIVGHIKIADRVTITAMTLVSKSITEPGSSYSSGTPMAATREWRRQAARFSKLDELHQRVRSLEKREL